MSAISFFRLATFCGKTCTSQLQACLTTTSLASTGFKASSITLSRFLTTSSSTASSIDPYQERVQSLQHKTEASLNQILERSANHSPAEVLAAQLRTDGSISTPVIGAASTPVSQAPIVGDSHEDDDEDDEEEVDNVSVLVSEDQHDTTVLMLTNETTLLLTMS